MRIHKAGGCGSESELVVAVLECIQCLTDDGTSMGGRSQWVCTANDDEHSLFNICCDIWFRRIMYVRTFTFLHMGVVYDVCRHASFLSDVVAIRYFLFSIFWLAVYNYSE